MSKIYCWLIIYLFLSVSPLRSETILQNEKISFEVCLNVIEVSSEQLSLTPKIKIDNNDLRVAEFKMVDGTLKISCNRQINEMVVSSF